MEKIEDTAAGRSGVPLKCFWSHAPVISFWHPEKKNQKFFQYGSRKNSELQSSPAVVAPFQSDLMSLT